MTHYEALELPENASAADIRHAYRRLVLLTHPDRTPDPAAHARYLAVNTAYEVLSAPGRRAQYDGELHQPTASSSAAPASGRARDAARRARRTRPTPRPPAPAAAPYAAEYARALRLARPLLLVSLVLGLGVMADLALATEHPEAVVDAQYLFHSRRYDASNSTSYWTQQGVFSVDAEMPIGTQVLVRRTPMRGTALSVRFSAAEPSIGCSSMYSGPRVIFWVGLLISALAGLAPMLSADQRLVASMANVVFLAATLLQLFQALP
ncbi:J domain-containing protein [Hymenobacter properus]|uniref:J domain-containing protein n=1 Tax=Hymenobacter properus TaxID=2791026 RepID=A0A931FLY6_9BACT|nr:J domain-containing protein [Hymenobacter properus]MBF9142531.1 J domain-containing protein [Hymenobacter properus]MBR7721338.1 J domain-containing protein [Microvirga sp. SRT04]